MQGDWKKIQKPIRRNKNETIWKEHERHVTYLWWPQRFQVWVFQTLLSCSHTCIAKTVQILLFGPGTRFYLPGKPQTQGGLLQNTALEMELESSPYSEMYWYWLKNLKSSSVFALRAGHISSPAVSHCINAGLQSKQSEIDLLASCIHMHSVRC